MKNITVTLHICGMSDETFSDTIMIYKPHHSIEKKYTIEENRLRNTTVGDIIDLFNSGSLIDIERRSCDKLSVEHVYILNNNMLVGLREDKMLNEVYDFIQTDFLTLLFFSVGGASIYYQGYRFTVHSNEDIHKNTPHVHVINDDGSCRYYLTTLEPMDKPNKEFRRDYKKIIQPYLKKNQIKLNQMWNAAQHGFVFPIESIDGKQYYPES